jgi:hypothetical protein
MQWTGTATELLLALRAANPDVQWPGTPKGLSQLLHKTPLGDIDFQSLKNGEGRRSIELTRIIPPKTTNIQTHPPMRRTAHRAATGGSGLPTSTATSSTTIPQTEPRPPGSGSPDNGMMECGDPEAASHQSLPKKDARYA